MSNNKINTLSIGDKVYHLSNSRIKMVVIGIIPEVNKVSCRWLDNEGKLHENEFLSEELEIYKYTPSSFVVNRSESKYRY